MLKDVVRTNWDVRQRYHECSCQLNLPKHALYQRFYSPHTENRETSITATYLTYQARKKSLVFNDHEKGAHTLPTSCTKQHCLVFIIRTGHLPCSPVPLYIADAAPFCVPNVSYTSVVQRSSGCQRGGKEVFFL
jgi:hypothetical protein